MTTYHIRPLLSLKVEFDKGILTYRMNYGVKLFIPVFMWYIEGEGKKILVDSGADAYFAKQVRGLKIQEERSFEDALASVDLLPEDIDLVLQTHLHWDHCGNTFKCKKARVVVQEDELKFALNPHPVLANTYHRPLFENLKFDIIKGDCEIAPGIELIHAPGATPGTQAICVNTVQGKAIISGICSIRENFESQDGVVAPGIHTNAMEAFDSTLRIKEMADIIIPQHEPELVGVRCIP